MMSNAVHFFLDKGNRGSSPVLIQDIRILNSVDLKSVNFACYLDQNKDAHDINVKFDNSLNALIIGSGLGQDGLKIGDVHSIHYGVKGKDINICD